MPNVFSLIIAFQLVKAARPYKVHVFPFLINSCVHSWSTWEFECVVWMISGYFCEKLSQGLLGGIKRIAIIFGQFSWGIKEGKSKTFSSVDSREIKWWKCGSKHFCLLGWWASALDVSWEMRSILKIWKACCGFSVRIITISNDFFDNSELWFQTRSRSLPWETSKISLKLDIVVSYWITSHQPTPSIWTWQRMKLKITRK